VFGQKSPIIDYNTGTDVSAEALFLEHHEESGVDVVEATTMDLSSARAYGLTTVTGAKVAAISTRKLVIALPPVTRPSRWALPPSTQASLRRLVHE
jgi:hypothetical protein